jgi:hypothetical protein
MMRSLGLAGLLVLTACAVPSTPRPEAISLGGDRLVARFPNGVSCRATVPLDGGAGRFEDCPHEATWEVEIIRRNWLEPLLGAAVAPYARITITGADGRETLFRTPPLRNDLRRR